MKKNKVIFSVEEKNETRLDQVLSAQDFCKSRSRAQSYISGQYVIVNSKTITKPSYKVKFGDNIEVLMPEKKESKLIRKNLPLDIFYEDESLLVVNKAAGMVVHPSHGHSDDTLVNALLHHTKDLSLGFNEERPGIVHRIDKDTSGLLVIAKNDEAHHFLAEQFQTKTIHRLYWAICFGKLKNAKGKIESYITRDDNDRKRYKADNEKGKLAITHYNTLKTYNDEISLLQVRLETGRTHQIRVHLKSEDCPIIADWMYANTKRIKNIKSLELRKKIENLNRFALHAAELGFIHPKTKENLFFRSSPPKDLMDILIFCDFLDLVQ